MNKALKPRVLISSMITVGTSPFAHQSTFVRETGSRIKNENLTSISLPCYNEVCRVKCVEQMIVEPSNAFSSIRYKTVEQFSSYQSSIRPFHNDFPCWTINF